MRIVAFLVVCLVALPLCAEDPSAQVSLGDVVQEIKSVANGYPPKVDGPEHRADIEKQWRWAEAGLLEYIAGLDSPNSGVELLLGDLYRMGYNLDIDGCGPKAVERLSRASSLDPRNPNPYYSLGRHYTFSSEAEKGELELLRGFALAGPENGTPFLFDLAWNNYIQKRFEVTVVLADRYLAKHPGDKSIVAVREFAQQALEGREIRTIEIPMDGLPDGKLKIEPK